MTLRTQESCTSGLLNKDVYSSLFAPFIDINVKKI